MEYLVTMTTRVPAGTSEAAVAEMRAREARRAAELARDGYLLRLWRPPLQPGEWRTMGLFRAADDGSLEQALASMPLRLWRSDEAIALGAHPNDPGADAAAADAAALAARRTGVMADGTAAAGISGPEYLITMTVTVPPGTPAAQVDDTLAREALRARSLAAQGYLRRLWTLPAAPGERRALGLWRAASGAEMTAVVDALPLRPWMEVQTTPLAQHPNDPPIR